MRVQEYELLFTALATDPEYRIPGRVVQAVMNRLPGYAGSTHLFPAKETILISAGILAALIATFVLIDLSPAIDWIRSLKLPRFAFDPRIIRSMTPLFKQLNGVLGLLPFAVLAFIMVALMDRLIKRFKHSSLLL
jgi:hypothetical protein